MKKQLLATLLITVTALTSTEAFADRGRRHHDNDDYNVNIQIHDGRNYYQPRYRQYVEPFRGHHNKPWKHGHNKGWKNKRYYDDRDVYIYAPQVVPPVNYYPSNNYYPPVRTSSISCDSGSNLAGQILGGAGGGVLGYQFGKGHGKTAAVIGGTILGTMLGSQLTSYDRNCTHQVFEYGNPGQQVAWVNPNNNYNYTIVPQQPYQVEGRYCREYQASAYVGGRRQETYGTACRQPDGDWEIVK